MFSRDKNKFQVNIKAEKNSNVIDFTAAQKEKKLPKLRRKNERASLVQRLASVDLRTPWVIRLLAVVFVLILSMLIL